MEIKQARLSRFLYHENKPKQEEINMNQEINRMLEEMQSDFFYKVQEYKDRLRTVRQENENMKSEFSEIIDRKNHEIRRLRLQLEGVGS